MTKIYFSYVSYLHPQFLAHSSPNPWNFLVVTVTNVSLVILMKCLSGPHRRMGLVARRTNHAIKGVKISVPSPDLQGSQGTGGWIRCQWSINWLWLCIEGLPRGYKGKGSACPCRRHKRCEFDPWARKLPWRRKWQPTPVFLSGKFHGQRSLADYCSGCCKELDMTERLSTCNEASIKTQNDGVWRTSELVNT